MASADAPQPQSFRRIVAFVSAAIPYRPEKVVLELGDDFYDRVKAADFPQCRLRFANRRWATRVGLGDLDDDGWANHFCRFQPLPGTLPEPLALRYHGHQFRSYNPDIGDGRGFLFAQLRDGEDRLLDLGTKGSGQTPYSRFGDGRLTLKGGVREILATEMLEALRVPTSKTFALFETGEQLDRNDEPSPTRSSVLTRLSHGHVRIGTFQRFAFYRDLDGLNRLVRYCLAHLLGGGEQHDEPGAIAFDRVARAAADLAAAYMAAGFVHGVLNSDNIAITGESFDYGPWRFTPDWDPGFIAAYFDHHGLYAFGRQPEAIHWNLAQLAGCLSLLGSAERLAATMERWPDMFQDSLVAALLRRLGVERGEPDEDRALAALLVEALESRAVTIDSIFFDWRGGRDPGPERYSAPVFRRLAAALEGRRTAATHAYWSDERACSLHIDEVEEIWTAIAVEDDWAPLAAKVDAIRRMGDAMRKDSPET